LLVVDDNDDNRYTLLQRLKRQGYADVATAANGREALDMLRARTFDLILLDVMMPELNGYEVLEQMKADERLRDVPVIMISALDQIESVVRCIELGAEDYLAKPFNPTLLRARVGASLEKKRLRDELRASLSRLEKEMDAARRLQAGMLPHDFAASSSDYPVELHALMEPAREVGGDLYDFFRASANTLTFVVADVSGKGADAALFMARTSSSVRLATELFQQLGPASLSPARVLDVVNRELSHNNGECMFVTVFLGFLDMKTGVLEYSNAGHPSPYRLGATVDPLRLPGEPQLPLGIASAGGYETHRVDLAPGEAVFVCSDGIAEAMNGAGEFYGEARLAAALHESRAAAPGAMIASIRSAVEGFAAGAPQADDITMLALRWQPRKQP
jgi:sigma-B regulation protein RsbU (phosphoserine phosphatase)